jgi:hypothetical protein
MSRVFVIITGIVAASASVLAQSKTPARRAAPAPAPKTTTAPATLTCPSELGLGVRSKLSFCDVLTGKDPAEGIIVTFPPHLGEVTLQFDLHNRHTYSEDEARANRGFASYTATIGVLTPDNTLLTRAVVSGEFRRQQDLLDRIAGGAGPGGVKAVAPLGSESISVTVSADVPSVSLLGEKLIVTRSDGMPAIYAAPGRPIAVVSNAVVEYTPAPAPAPRRGR